MPFPDDDEPFPREDFRHGSDDGRFLGGWPTEDELGWFPKDLIEECNGTIDTMRPNYDQLFFPEGAADAIAAELTARGHSVKRPRPGISQNGSTSSTRTRPSRAQMGHEWGGKKMPSELLKRCARYWD
ncbi:hypothetical protein [Mycolicibacterium sp.]|uniref:hypothetical protein n=1 Tax=Mycolicibacterium sp. TaxID=2320850 RepID=UPI001D3013D5|nr:hypothetical protein [Mycolicibacterium sp.]MCB1290344.1 hypothetical protein [Mycobacterium sp.]MCB9408329.1 hypothetical protein [Mycolicibacterium sp.]